jgi:hypothetical protein
MEGSATLRDELIKETKKVPRVQAVNAAVLIFLLSSTLEGILLRPFLDNYKPFA